MLLSTLHYKMMATQILAVMMLLGSLSISSYGAILGPISVVIAALFGRKKLQEISINVDGRMTEALNRIAALEAKLQLSPGAPIPPGQVTTAEVPSA